MKLYTPAHYFVDLTLKIRCNRLDATIVIKIALAVYGSKAIRGWLLNWSVPFPSTLVCLLDREKRERKRGELGTRKEVGQAKVSSQEPNVVGKARFSWFFTFSSSVHSPGPVTADILKYLSNHITRHFKHNHQNSQPDNSLPHQSTPPPPNSQRCSAVTHI